MKKLKARIAAFADSPSAWRMLILLSFLESCILPISPLIILIPMILVRPEKAWRLVLAATLAALLGCIVGYFLGYWFMAQILPWIENWGLTAHLNHVQHWFSHWGLFALLPASILPFPSYKYFAIAAGAMHLKLAAFLLVSFIVRLIHFSLALFLLVFRRKSITMI